MPRYVIVINVLALAMTVPTVIYNTFEFIRIKLLVLKAIFFIVPIIFLIFKSNLLKYMFGTIPQFQYIKNREWNITNSVFIISSGIALIISIWAYIYLSDNAFLNFKIFFLPFIAYVYIIPIIYYGSKSMKTHLKNKNNNS